MDEIAECKPEGITWRTWPRLLEPQLRKKYPEGYYNLGLAHGVSGIVAFLGCVCSLRHELKPLGNVQTKSRRMLERAVSWLFELRLKGKTRSLFPYCTGPGAFRVAGRAAWCYGDLGIAASLLIAASAVNNRRWRAEALRLAKHVARRPSGDLLVGIAAFAMVQPASLMYSIECIKQPVNILRNAAREWFERTLTMRSRSQGIAGFLRCSGEEKLAGYLWLNLVFSGERQALLSRFWRPPPRLNPPGIVCCCFHFPHTGQGGKESQISKGVCPNRFFSKK